MSPGSGRTAFFSAGEVPHEAPTASNGRRALFSAPPRRAGTIVVECTRCDARTPVPVLMLGTRLLLSLWIPFKPHPRFLMCPACNHPAWTTVHWRTLLAGA